MTQTHSTIRIARSQHLDPVRAAAELAQELRGAPAALRVVYASSLYDPDLLGTALFAELCDAPLVGCTTAGEFGPGGYLDAPGLVGLALPSSDFQADVAHFTGLRELPVGEMVRGAAELLVGHQSRSGTGRSFGLVLADGLSVREEAFVSAVSRGLGELPLCGGSAGDDLAFRSTRLLVDGGFVEDAATLALVRTRRPFEVFKLQHIEGTPRKLVVTAADPGRRIVHEIDGLPAVEAYAEAVGRSVDELSPEVFSTHPVVVRVGGKDYVRSIQRCGEDGSLTFFCAIDEGIVLTLAESRDMVANLEAEVDRLEGRLGELDLTLGFDCVLRRLESRQRALTAGVDSQLQRLRACGFATYGEQFGPMHVNQTLTGVAIGR